MSTTRRIAKSLSQIDHRVIGEQQQLFFFNELSKGSCFFQPRGAHIYNKLLDYLRAQYKRRHYEEVITPNIYDCRLWQTSGHWEHYKENMMRFKLGERDFSLKPMNCPGHCLMFKNLGTLSHERLPIRWADFGVLHRDEITGSLLGLTRVRRFQQDDAHIFCAPEQVECEVRNCLDFAKDVYQEFGFTFEVALSLRPTKYLGATQLWDHAEDSLRQALKSFDIRHKEQENEGAFYGPKIDLIVKDCHNRQQQCATIQLDFQLPQRFDLAYKDKLGQLGKPVLIHRAILGSLERFIAMLAEHTGGHWPFWLSPLQAVIIPAQDNGEQLADYACQVRDRLLAEGFTAECELGAGLRLRRKILEAHKMRWNFILIVGNKEAQTNSVTVRLVSGAKVHQLLVPVERLVQLFKGFRSRRSRQVKSELLEACASSG